MLTTVSRAMALMGVAADDTTQGIELQPLLQAASVAIEERCRRSFGYANHTEMLDGARGNYLPLRQYPVHAAVVTLPHVPVLANVEVISEDGMLWRRDGWPCGDRLISVTYTAGYKLPGAAADSVPQGIPVLPESLEFACIMLAKHLQRDPGVTQERVGDISVSYAQDGDKRLPGVVEALIAPHVRQL